MKRFQNATMEYNVNKNDLVIRDVNTNGIFFAKKTIDEEIKVVAVEKYDPSACTNLAENCEDFF